MKKALMMLVAVCSLLLYCPKPTIAQDSLTTAEKFRKSGRYHQAIAVLKKEVEQARLSDTKMAKIHYQLGICYLDRGDIGQAEENFAAAVRFDERHGYSIGESFRTAGLSALKNGKEDTAFSLFRKAGEYEPAMKKTIPSELFSIGKKSLDDGLIGPEENAFKVAASLDYFQREKICRAYTGLGDKATDEKCYYFYSKAGGFCDQRNEKAGRRLLVLAQTAAKKPGREQEAWKYKKGAIQYLGKVVVDRELPEEIIYPPGDYILPPLNAKEITSFWISFPEGRSENNGATSSHDYNYILHFDDGTSYRDGKDVVIPHKTRARFKIEAITDQPGIRLVVK